MKPGQASQTAIWVCMARALADARGLAGFRDPTARALLSEDARARLDQPAGELLESRIGMVVTRTRAIDDAIRAAGHPQVVILGAGLDGRAWRLPELGAATVFEVDHPDSQAAKRARVTTLPQTAREVRFVAVDFTTDSLADRLAAAGHDAALPTTWIWEGVIMYLTPSEIDATLAVMRQRSALGSHLVIVYAAPGGKVEQVAEAVRRAGEPFRSSLAPEAMRELLARHGFAVVRDDGIPALAASLSTELVEHTRDVGHVRVVTAERA